MTTFCWASSDFTSNVWNNNLYRRLGVSQNASTQEIRAAYRRLVQKYHPDLVEASDLGKIKTHTNILVRINEAADVLLDREKRLNYDRTLGVTPTRSRRSTMPPAPANFTPNLSADSINWELLHGEALDRFRRDWGQVLGTYRSVTTPEETVLIQVQALRKSRFGTVDFYFLKNNILHPIYVKVEHYEMFNTGHFNRYAGEIMTADGTPTGFVLLIGAQGNVLSVRNLSALAESAAGNPSTENSEYFNLKYERPSTELMRQIDNKQISFGSGFNLFQYINSGHFCKIALSPKP